MWFVLFEGLGRTVLRTVSAFALVRVSANANAAKRLDDEIILQNWSRG